MSLADSLRLISRLSSAQRLVMLWGFYPSDRTTFCFVSPRRAISWVLIILTAPSFSSSYKRNSAGGSVAASISSGSGATGSPAGPQRRGSAGSPAGAQHGARIAAAAAGIASPRLRDAAGPCPGTPFAAHGRTTRGAGSPSTEDTTISRAPATPARAGRTSTGRGAGGPCDAGGSQRPGKGRGSPGFQGPAGPH